MINLRYEDIVRSKNDVQTFDMMFDVSVHVKASFDESGGVVIINYLIVNCN